MSDYIKRSYAKNAICSSCANPCSLVEKANSPCVTIIELFRIPSADVAPVRHGRWKNYKDEHTCSVCDYSFCDEWYSDDDVYNYCPNCGAKMGEEEINE